MIKGIYGTLIQAYDTSLRIQIEEKNNGDLTALVRIKRDDNSITINIKDLIQWVVKFKPEFIEHILEEHSIEKYKKAKLNPYLNPEIIKQFEQKMINQKELLKAQNLD